MDINKLPKEQLLVLDSEKINEVISSFSDDELKEYVDGLDKESLIILFDKIEADLGSKIIMLLDDDEIKKVIDNIPFEESVALINELEEEEREDLLEQNQKIFDKLNVLKADFLSLHPKDVADKIDEMDDEEREYFFNLFTASELSDFFAYLDEEDAAKYLQILSDNKASDVLESMYVDDAVDIINELDKKEKDNYLELMDEEISDEIEEISEYSDNEVGSIMSTDYISIDANMDVKDAMKILVNNAPDVDTINTLFVNKDNKFFGILDFRKLIVTKSPCLVGAITNQKTKFCEVTDSINDAVNIIDDYDIYALPVLKNGVLKGIVTIDDGFEALRAQREEDYNQLAGLSGEREDNETVISKVKRRMPWLATLIFLDLIVCILISMFEDVINSYTVLVLFQPVILGLSGNVGMQSLAVCVRSISNNELDDKKNKAKHIFRELRNGLILGLIIGILTFIVSWIFLTITKSAILDGVDKTIIISSIVSISIWVALSLSCLIGCVLPICFSSMHLDPSAASGPFITTLNDVIAITTYFTLAMLLLRIV